MPGVNAGILSLFSAAESLLKDSDRAPRVAGRRSGDEAADLTEELLDPLDSEDVGYRTETVVGRPGREIVSFAEEHDVDGIIIGSHGRGVVSRVLLGSVAEDVVRRAPTTVTVVR